MHLIQLLLPLYDNHKNAFPADAFTRVRAELTDTFGGVTAHLRAPAQGIWKESDDAPATRDDVVIFEVMADELDAAWWRVYRQELERRFRQDTIVIRAIEARTI